MKKSIAFVLICLTSAMAFSVLSVTQVSGQDYTKVGVNHGDWASYVVAWSQPSASIKLEIIAEVPGVIRFYETDSYANGTSTKVDCYETTTGYNAPNNLTLLAGLLSAISPSPGDYRYPIFISSNLSGGDHTYPSGYSEPFPPKINATISEKVLGVERQLNILNMTRFYIEYDQQSGILVKLVIKQPDAVNVTISGTNIWSPPSILPFVLPAVGVMLAALVVVLVIYERRKKKIIEPSPPPEEVGEERKETAGAKRVMRGTSSDSYVTPRASIHRKLLYVFLFALSTRLIIFSLAVALGERSYSAIGFYDLENYNDFTYYYVRGVSSFIEGLMPYQQQGYAFPPLFLYLLTPFALLSLPSWTMALPLVVLDGATVIPVFLIANKLMNPKRAVIASIAFAVAPINLYYNDFLWLNSSPVTFFTLLAVYWFLSKKHEYAFFSLAIATLFRQTAFVLFPVFAVALMNESNRMNTVRNVALYGTTCFIGSLPYIVTIPADYLSCLGLGFLTTGAMVTSYSASYPTNLGWVFGSNAYSAVMPFLLGALLISLAILCLTMYRNRVVGDKRFVTYVLYALLLLNALFPRGIYKYYLAGVTPLGAVFVRGAKTAALFLGLNVLLLILPRILTPWFVLALLILPLIKICITKHTSSDSIQGATHESSDQAKALNPNPPSYNRKVLRKSSTRLSNQQYGRQENARDE